MSTDINVKKLKRLFVDYKDPISLGRYLMEGGKIIPARLGKTSAKQQKMVTRAIKKSRTLALVPIGIRAYDDMSRRIEPISPKPFEI